MEKTTMNVQELASQMGISLGNGYDVEISGVNTSSTKKKANIYLWKDGLRIVERRIGVPQEEISRAVDALYEKYSDADENQT